ncbi:histidine phosphatase family protein [Paenibacillus sp. IB182496]|uniref:Histidine phosphatase family protein n=1 Tax=Paenibacillus sabuli TaxID=2772509 RepID=A0A927GRY0_9BACL|nr:histidine phosphatase family protein [Paenibacillus sabuli]MBD2845147.1 histidine phosphatase family protein [Paenibacillus sabuli]
MQLGWVRHGRTNWNALGKIQGQTDIPLTKEGLQQADLLAKRLQRDDYRWDAVVSSPLQRAAQTAAVLAEALDVPLLAPDDRLKERAFGEIEGTTEEARIARWGAQWRLTYEGQESDEAVRARGLAFVRERLERKTPERLLVVSHGSFLTCLLHTLCEGLDESYIGNMSYSVMDDHERQWRILLHNCTAHLQFGEADV